MGENLDLGRVLGRLEEGVEQLTKQLAEHTQQDTANFEELKKEIRKLQTTRAIAIKWGSGIAAAAVGVAEAARAFMR
jgi:SMC interacting uncharacterized protein involved in chromosome segregation